MPVYPIEWTEPRLFGYYPAMGKRDAELWERWLKQSHPNVLRVAYNVALGGLIPDVQNATDAELKGWQYNTAAKIDALVDVGPEWWVIEVKPAANLNAPGQAIAYVVLLAREGLTELPLIPTVLSDTVGPDFQYVCQQLGCQLFLAPELPPGRLLDGVPRGPQPQGYETTTPPPIVTEDATSLPTRDGSPRPEV